MSIILQLSNRNITDTHEQEKIIGLMKRGGYNSETVSNFNIGRLAPKQWFGEEGMLLGHDVYMYSIIAASQVIVYEITKEKFGNLPSEVKSAMILSAKNKISWILSRKSQVTEAYTQIFCMNEDRNIKMANDGITAKTKELNDIVESFPKASGQALEKIKTRKERLRSADIAKKNKERIPSLKDINPLSPRNNNAGSMKDLDTKPGIKVSRPQTAVSRIRGDETFKFPISPRNEYGKISENNSPTHSPDMTILNPKPEPKQEIETVGDKTYVYKSGHGIKAEPRIYLSIFKMETSSRTYRTQKNKLQEVMKVGNKSRTPSPDPRPQSGKAGSKERSKSPSAGTKTNPSSAAQTSRPKSGILKDPKPIRTDDEQFWTATGTMTGLGTAETLISPKGKTTFTLKSTNETQGHHKVRNSIGLIVSPTKSKHRSTIVGLDLKRPMTTSGVRLKEDRANMVVFKEQTIDGFGLLGIKNHRRLMMSSIFKPAELRGYITSPASNVK